MAQATAIASQGSAYDRLQGKQKLFVEFYCGKANSNATLAAKLAGYSEASAYTLGCEALKNVDVQLAIKERFALHGFDEQECLRRLIDISRGAQSAYLETNEAGEITLDAKGLIKAGLGRNIKKICNGKHGQTIEFYDAQRALEVLGKSMGVLRERVDVVHHQAPDPEAERERLQSRIEELRAALPGGVLEAEFVVEG